MRLREIGGHGLLFVSRSFALRARDSIGWRDCLLTQLTVTPTVTHQPSLCVTHPLAGSFILPACLLPGSLSLTRRRRQVAWASAALATRRKGAVDVPGSHARKYAEPPRWPKALRNMRTLSAHAMTRVPRLQRRTAGPSKASTSTRPQRPTSHGTNENVGIGNHGIRARNSKTRGL